jgi:DNA invertase Pin-like site-specific DNA recombinase
MTAHRVSLADLQARLRAEEPYRSIAAALGVSLATVGRWAKLLELTHRGPVGKCPAEENQRRRRLIAAHGYRGAARRLGLSPQALRQWAARHGVASPLRPGRPKGRAA